MEFHLKFKFKEFKLVNFDSPFADSSWTPNIPKLLSLINYNSKMYYSLVVRKRNKMKYLFILLP